MDDHIHALLEATIGKFFGRDITCREPIDHCDDYQPGSLVEVGRTGIKLFKKFLMPCGLCAAAPVLKEAPPPNCPVPCSTDEKRLIRPSELPIYINDTSAKKIPCANPEDTKPSSLEEGFGTIRKSLGALFIQYDYVTDSVKTKVSTGLEHSEFLFEYLKEESNVGPRIGAIGIGALSGLILSLRGGFFKRVIYTSTGALTVAAICYPKQASEGIDLAKHYANIGYNFAYGVKPGDDEQLKISFPEFSVPKLPTSFDGFLDQAGVAIGSLSSKASELFSQLNESTPPEGKPKQS